MWAKDTRGSVGETEKEFRQMSGVFGVIDAQKRPVSAQLHRMAESLRLREWTRTQVWAEEQPGVGLGQVNIGLFSADAQPFQSEDEALAVVFFGELYYTEPLRRQLAADGYSLTLGTEAELICRLYQAKEESFIHDLQGIFVLALWDGKRGRLLVANDRFGLIPTYYANVDGKLVFAPEVKGILSDPAFEKRLDLTGMAQFFRFQRLLGDHTFFEGLHLLPHASLLRFDQASNSVDISHYWYFDQIPTWPAGATFDDAVEETGRLLRRAVQARTQGEHQVGVYLSGGLDSRTLLGLASQIHPPIVSLTYGVPNSRDVHYATRIARRVGSPHHLFLHADGHWVRDEADFHLEVTEGFTTWVHNHAAPTLMPARDLMDVNLTGFIGDGLLGARALTFATDIMDVVDDVDFIARMYVHYTQLFCWPGYTESEARLLFSETFYPQVRDLAFQSMSRELSKLEKFDFTHRLGFFNVIHQGTRLSNLNVVYQRAFFEARYPFCDYALAEFIYSMPIEYRLHDRLYLAMINREIPEVVWIPRNTDQLPLTDHRSVRQALNLWLKVRRRINKRQLRTIHEDPEGWLRRDLRNWAEELLFDRRTLERGIFNPAFLRSIFERHMSGREEHTIGKIAPIMTFEMMLRRFYDD
jgi:asparagine synthase (glutamine-hydrolysing)